MVLAFERLENRLLLAATAELKGATLVITDDGTGDAVTLTGGAEGEVTVAGADVGDGMYDDVKHIKIIGGDGADTYFLEALDITGNVTADLKGDGDAVFITGATDIGGNVKIKLGDGDDACFVNDDAAGVPIAIGKNLMVDLGSGSGGDAFFIEGDDVGEETTIGGGVTVKGKADVQAVFIDNVMIGKNLNVNLGDGDDAIFIGSGMDEAGLAVTIGGNCILKLGEGDDAAFITPDDGGTVAIGKNLTVDLGNDDGVDAAGDVFFATADTAGDDVITIGGNATIKSKSGDDAVFIDGVTVTKNVTVTLGDGDDVVFVSGGGGAIDVAIGGNLKVNLGDGEEDALFVERTTVDGNARIDGGKGDMDFADETMAMTVDVMGTFTSKNFELGSLA